MCCALPYQLLSITLTTVTREHYIPVPGVPSTAPSVSRQPPSTVTLFGEVSNIPIASKGVGVAGGAASQAQQLVHMAQTDMAMSDVSMARVVEASTSLSPPSVAASNAVSPADSVSTKHPTPPSQVSDSGVSTTLNLHTVSQGETAAVTGTETKVKVKGRGRGRPRKAKGAGAESAPKPRGRPRGTPSHTTMSLNKRLVVLEEQTTTAAPLSMVTELTRRVQQLEAQFQSLSQTGATQRQGGMASTPASMATAPIAPVAPPVPVQIPTGNGHTRPAGTTMSYGPSEGSAAFTRTKVEMTHPVVRLNGSVAPVPTPAPQMQYQVRHGAWTAQEAQRATVLLNQRKEEIAALKRELQTYRGQGAQGGMAPDAMLREQQRQMTKALRDKDRERERMVRSAVAAAEKEAAVVIESGEAEIARLKNEVLEEAKYAWRREADLTITQGTLRALCATLVPSDTKGAEEAPPPTGPVQGPSAKRPPSVEHVPGMPVPSLSAVPSNHLASLIEGMEERAEWAAADKSAYIIADLYHLPTGDLYFPSKTIEATLKCSAQLVSSCLSEARIRHLDEVSAPGVTAFVHRMLPALSAEASQYIDTYFGGARKDDILGHQRVMLRQRMRQITPTEAYEMEPDLSDLYLHYTGPLKPVVQYKYKPAVRDPTVKSARTSMRGDVAREGYPSVDDYVIEGLDEEELAERAEEIHGSVYSHEEGQRTPKSPATPTDPSQRKGIPTAAGEGGWMHRDVGKYAGTKSTSGSTRRQKGTARTARKRTPKKTTPTRGRRPVDAETASKKQGAREHWLGLLAILRKEVDAIDPRLDDIAQIVPPGYPAPLLGPLREGYTAATLRWNGGRWRSKLSVYRLRGALLEWVLKSLLGVPLPVWEAPSKAGTLSQVVSVDMDSMEAEGTLDQGEGS
ncbi:hypothetical protein KIPB_002250 [Kipferlia bialata]|uniref:Uncharacterized protein n=1 Tax=Kipferlia bialata TaxID=797122 RepID=A0A9K3CRX8_9EUKA|nr:hypothetical protein KIPB_002250 [Kipferlia bialata]|eukprot:g2250.t1